MRIRRFFYGSTLIAFIGCSSNGHQKGSPSDPASSVPALAAQEEKVKTDTKGKAALSPDMVEPYFKDGNAAKGLELYNQDNWAEAAKAFEGAIQEEKDEAALSRLYLMIAVCQANDKKYSEAAIGYERAIAHFPLLADWLRFQAARAYFFSNNMKKTSELAGAVSIDSTRGPDAALLVGDVIRASGDQEKTFQHYSGYLDAGHGLRKPEVMYRKAVAAFALGKKNDALALWKTIFVSYPENQWGKRALEEFNKHDGYTITGQLNAQELLKRGLVYFDAMRNEEGERDFAAARALSTLPIKQQCIAAYHQGTSIYRQRNRTRAVPVYQDAIRLCDEAKDVDLYVKSAYQAGRSYGKLEQDKDAIASYQLIESRYPKHSYADDARLRRAHEWTENGDDKKAVELWASIPDAYPDGDMKAEAAWRVAWHHYKEKNYKQAARWLRKQIELEPIADHWERTGQAQYWLGRTLKHLRQHKASGASYRDVVRLYPLSYYSLLALNRLRESHPKLFASVVAEMKDDFESPQDQNAGFKPRVLYGSEGFRRGLTFLKLGLHNASQKEFDAIGLKSPPHRNRVEDEDEADLIWAAAYLNHHAKRYTQSHWTTRWHVLDYRRHWPIGAWREKWDIAYPKGYWDLLDKYATQHKVPTELQIAFVREESAFDPKRESWANAHGLTQMIFPTAHRFAKGTGIEVTRESLFDPEKNVIIGANFLGFLMKKWSAQVGLVVPSYNAGEGAVTKWRRIRKHWPQDEFGEQIPYDETRRYNKRVTESYFAYSYLKDGSIPTMSNKQP